MDPYGNYDCFLCEPRYRPRYRFDEVASLLPYRLRLEKSYSNHSFYPLSLPLMKRPDDRDLGLAFFDLVTLVDISPGVLEASDIRTLRSYVESGGALLMFGGPNSLGNSVASYGDWADFLPVAMQKEKAVIEPSIPMLQGAFAKFNNDLGAFGLVNNIQAVEPRHDARVLATAAGRPLLVARQFGRGRIMVISAAPDGSDGAVSRGVLDTGSFYGSDGYANLLGLCISWLLRRDHDLQIAGFKAPPNIVRVGASPPLCLEPVLGQGTFELSTRRSGNEIALDRDPEFNEVVAEQSGSFKSGTASDLSYQATGSAAAAGVYRSHVRMEGNGEGKGRYDYINLSFYNIKTPEHGYNAKMMRIATVNVQKENGIRAYPVGFHNALAVGETMEIVVEPIGNLPADACVAAAITRRGSGRPHTVVDTVPAGENFSFSVPNLQTGDYALTVTLTNNNATADTVDIPVTVVAPLREEEARFCVVGQSVSTSMRAMRDWYDEMVADGFNCFTLTNVQRLSQDEQNAAGHASAVESYWAEMIQKDGFTLWGEYTKTVILSERGWQYEEGESATVPCPYTPQHRDATHNLIWDRMAAAQFFPRLVSMEIVDEPHLYSGNIDYSEPARQKFKEQYGYEKPSWDTYLAARDGRRLEYFNSAIDYADIAFRNSFEEINEWLQERKREFPQIHHVYAQGGIHAPHKAVFDQLLWSRHCHSIEFDSYPWLYGNFRLWDKVRMGEPRYMFAYYRVLADYLDKPIGFFVETNDFYYPQEIWPANSSNELLYLALGCGTTRFHTMIMGSYGTLNGVYEREKALAQELRRVQEIAPLLAHARPVRTNLGVLNAWADHLYNPPPPEMPAGYEGIGFYSLRLKPYDKLYPNFVEPLNGLEAIYRAYGTLPDVVDERLLETELSKYRAFALIGAVTTMLPRSFDLLYQFVSDGGVLILDQVPYQTTDGSNDERFRALLPSTWTYLAEGLRVCTASVGKGSMLVIDGDLHDLMSRSYEQGQPMLREELISAIAQFLQDNGVRASAYSDNPEGIGVYEMRAGETPVLTFINHADTVASARIVVSTEGENFALLKDYISGRSLDFIETDDGISFEVTLPSREAIIAGVYQDVPQSSELQVTPEVGASGTWQWQYRLLNAAGAPAQGCYAATVRVFSPSGQRMKCFERFVPLVNGVLTGECTMPLNPETGTWTVTGFNKLTFQEITATFEVV